MYSTEKNTSIDRQKYNLIGKWKNSDNDVEEEIYFYYVANRSYRLANNGRFQALGDTATIAVSGYHQFTGHDTITLDDDTKLRINEITEVKEQVNFRIIHLVKPRVIEQILSLG